MKVSKERSSVEMKKYRVGQILYAILNKDVRIYPLQCIEEVHKRTLDGETIAYIVRGGIDQNARMDVSEVDGEIFESIDKAKQWLIEKSTINITKLCEAAAQKALDWYGYVEQQAPPKEKKVKEKKKQEQVQEEVQEAVPQQQETTSEEYQYVILPDGTKARMRVTY
jgi:hypothetical protein